MKYTELYEKKQHGSIDFPIQYYHLDKNHPKYEMHLHWHNSFEIVIVYEGCFTLYLNNVEYQLYKGDIALINCGTLHRGEPEKCVYDCVVFDLNMLRRQQNDIIASYISPLISGDLTVKRLLHPDNSMLYATAASLFNVLKNKPEYYEFSVYSILFNLFSQLFEKEYISEVERNKRSGRQTDAILTLLDWIELHYQEAITLAKLSEISGMNEKYLCRLFKVFTDHTPIDYVNRLRIECACQEMQNGHRTITEIAFDCGFNDLSYFSRTFKKHKGITPKEFCKTKNGSMHKPN